MIFVWRRWLMGTESRIVRARWVLKKHSQPVKLTFVAFRTAVSLFSQKRFTFCDQFSKVIGMFDYCSPIKYTVMRFLVSSPTFEFLRQSTAKLLLVATKHESRFLLLFTVRLWSCREYLSAFIKYQSFWECIFSLSYFLWISLACVYTFSYFS